MSEVINSVRWVLLLGTGLLGPGWLLGRSLGTPAGVIGSFVGSAVILMNIVILLEVFKLKIDQPHISILLGSVSVVLVIVAIVRRNATSPHAELDSTFRRLKAYHCFIVPAAIGLTAVVLKAWSDPLSGYDTGFRWNFLAKQMFEHGNLDFYPPIAAADFQFYGWCDGIAPLVSSLYLWSYLAFGYFENHLTAPIVILQAVVLGAAVYRLAFLFKGPAAGWCAAALLPTSCLLLWGVANGQETGLTAIAVVSQILFLRLSRTHPTQAWLIWAGIASAMAALAREYGVLFVAIGGIDLAFRKCAFRDWAKYLIPTMMLTAPWYCRNWVKTGNPVWPHNVANLFTTNLVHEEYMSLVHQLMGIGSSATPGANLALATMALAGVTFALGLIGIWRARHEWTWPFAVGATLFVWLWSIDKTSGGYIYSLRVLTPALAVCSVAGGCWLQACGAVRGTYALCTLITLLSIDSAGRAFFVPSQPFVAWWAVPAPAWLQLRNIAAAGVGDAIRRVLVGAAGKDRILVSDPFTHAQMVQSGATTTILFSPEVHFLFDRKADFSICISSLNDLKVRFIMLPTSSIDPGILAIQQWQHPFFQKLKSFPPVLSSRLAVVYDVKMLMTEKTPDLRQP